MSPAWPPVTRTVKPLEAGPSPPGHKRYVVRSGQHRRNSLVELDVAAAGSRVLDVLNKLPEAQYFGIARAKRDIQFCESEPPLKFAHISLLKIYVALR
jgi:hypothetical protein